MTASEKTRRNLLLVNISSQLASFLRAGLTHFGLQRLESLPESGDLDQDVRMLVLQLSGGHGDQPREFWRAIRSIVAKVPVLGLVENEAQALAALRTGCFEAMVAPHRPSQVLRAIQDGIEGHTWLRKIRELDRQNRRLAGQNGRLRRQIEALLTVGERARFHDARRPLEDVLTGILEEIKRILQLDCILLAVVNTQRKVAELKLALGVQGLQAGDTCAEIDGADPVWSRLQGKQVPTVLGPRRLRDLPPKMMSNFASGLVAAPLLAKGEMLGTLLGSRKPALWSRRDLRLLQVFAGHASAAIENGHLYYDVIRSEEQLKETQSQLIEAERLAVIGQMTVSIRHEINNPLCNISLIAQTLHRDLRQARPELVEMLDDVMKNVRRIQEVTHKLSQLKSVQLTEYLPNQLMVDLR